MRLDTVLKQAAGRHPALVFQVSWANGLDIIRDLSAEGVPLLALDANERALGLRSRLAAGMVCPDPRGGRGGLRLVPRGPRPATAAQGRPLPDPRPVHLADLPARGTPGPLLLHPVLPLGDDAAPARQARPDGGGLARGRGHAEDGLRRLRRGPRARRGRDRLPVHLQAGGVARLQDALPPARARDRLRRRAPRGLRQGGRLRHADAAGHRAGRRRGAVHARLVPGRAEPAAGAVHRSQAAPAPAAVRPRQHGGEQVGARARGGRAAPAARARLPRRQPGGVQARHARRPLPPHGGQRASLDVALARHRLRRQPLARRLPRRHRRAVHVARARSTGSSGSSRSPTRATPSGAGAAATSSSGRGSRATAASAWTACTRCATRSPAPS